MGHPMSLPGKNVHDAITTLTTQMSVSVIFVHGMITLFLFSTVANIDFPSFQNLATPTSGGRTPVPLLHQQGQEQQTLPPQRLQQQQQQQQTQQDMIVSIIT